uniref:Envelope glycoprotein H n=1 Tax=Canid alphaherpesvirus 1 TaxID=170325 RepID=A0A172DS76_9ALPH|nr:envelope glycoprotein H [Canid alphaherpesvirus 1]
MEVKYNFITFIFVIFFMLVFSNDLDNGEYKNLSLSNDFSYSSNVNITTIENLFSYNNKFVFFFIFNKDSKRENGNLFLFPNFIFKSNKTENNYNIKSQPSVKTINGFFFNPYINLYLSSKYLIDFGVIPESSIQDWYFPRSIQTSTEQNPFGFILSPKRHVPNNGFFNKHKNLYKDGLLNDIMYVNLNSFSIPRKTYIPIYESTWPFDISLFESTLIQNENFCINITIGKEFMGMSITSSKYPPLEMITTPHDANVEMITRYKASMMLDPPGPSEGPLYKVFIIGYGTSKTDSNMYKIMQTIASYPEESLDYRYHLSMANFEVCFLLTYERKFLTNKMDMEYFYKIFSRLSTALFSLSEMVRLSKYILNDEIIDIDFNINILTNIIVNHKMFKLSKQLITSSQVNILLESSRENIVNNLNTFENYNLIFKNDELKIKYLKAVYTYLEIPTEKSLIISRDIINTLYNNSLYETIDWNVTSRKSLFLATSLLLLKTQNIVELRKIILQCTSMCTSDHAISIEWSLENILNAKNNFKKQFSITDMFSPCMTSTRYDLIEDLHIVDLISVIPNNENFKNLFSMGHKAASVVNSNILFGSNKIKMLIPELFICKIDINFKFLAILPLNNNNSYIITRKILNRGLTYNVNGIDIANPIFISYINSSNCLYSSVEILPLNLINPKNSKECLYCGSVIMRYLSSGVIIDLLYINDKEAETQLAAGVNSTIPSFNPLSYPVNLKTLLLFPNGTIVTINSITSHEQIKFSNTFIVISIVGIIITSFVVYGIFKMLCSFSYVKYSLLK